MRGRKRHIKKWAKSNSFGDSRVALWLGHELARQVYAKARHMAVAVRVHTPRVVRSELFDFGDRLLSTAGFYPRRSILCATARPRPGRRRQMVSLTWNSKPMEQTD